MEIMYQVSVHKGSGGLGYGDRRWLVVPDIPREGKLELVNDWSEINLGSRINNGYWQASPRLDRREFAF